MINNVLRSLIRIVFPPWPIMKGSVGAALGRLLMHKSQTPVSPAPISLPEALPHLKIGAKLGKTFELTKFFQLTFLKGLKAHASFAPASPTAKELFRDSCRHCRFALRLSLYVGTGFTDSRRKSSRCLTALPLRSQTFLVRRHRLHRQSTKVFAIPDGIA